MVRAVVDTVEMRPLESERLLHPGMDVPELGLLDQSSPHAGLIGDDDGQQAGLVDLLDGLEAVGIDLDKIIGVGIPHISIDVSVSIQENGLILQGSHLWQMS